MSRTRISFMLDGNEEAVKRVVRRMLDTAGFAEVLFLSDDVPPDSVEIRVPIRVPTKDGRTVAVSAITRGEWAAHRTVVEGNELSELEWSVTHMPMGMRIPINIAHPLIDEETAILIASALAREIPAGQIHSAKPPPNVVAEIQRVVNGILWP